MNDRQGSKARIAWSVAAALCLATASRSAAAAAMTATYLVQSESASGNSAVSSTEVLTIVSANGVATITLQPPTAGKSETVVSTIDSRGVLGLKTTDLAINCYDIVQDVLSNARDLVASPSLPIYFAGSPIVIPLQLSWSSLAGGMKDIVVSGGVQGSFDYEPHAQVSILVGGRMTAAGSTLFSAQLREATIVTTSKIPIAQASCSITRVVPAATAILM